MQFKLYRPHQLINLLSSYLKPSFSGVLTLETKVDSWQNQKVGKFAIHKGELVYGGPTIPDNQKFARKLGHKLQPKLIESAISIASEKIKNTLSVRELIEILVKLKVFTWEDIEIYSNDRIVLMLEQFDSYPGRAQWEDNTNFDLCFGEDRHGLDWNILKRDLISRQQQWSSLAPTIPSMNAVPFINNNSLSKIKDPIVQEHLKTYVDGCQTLVDIANAIGKDPLSVADYYFKFVNSGVVNFNNSSSSNITQNVNKPVGTTANNSSNAYMPTVLSVDDSPIVQASIKQALRGHYNVMPASSAADALKVISLNSIDLLLIDFAMPEIDGLELCRLIRQLPKFKDLPIIMVTSREGFFDKIKCQIAGTDAHITKPFKPEELIAVIDKYIKVGQA